MLAACGKSVPKPDAIRAAVERYLVAYKKESCDGGVTLDSLKVQRVGAWQDVGGGFPVFADFAVTCHGDKAQTTFSASDGATTAAALCFARRAGNDWQCALPAFAADAERELKRQMEEAMKRQQK